MTITFIDIVIIFCIIILFDFFFRNIIDLLKSKLFHKKDNYNSSVINVTPEEKESDMSLIYEALDIFILKELHNFSTKDFTFSDDSTIKELFKNNYRMLINCLLSPNQFIENELTNGKEYRSFFSIFVNKVYLNYVAETSNNIKSLLFKYYSGYTKEDYFNDDKKVKRPEPSCLPFIINYVRNYLWCRYEENEDAEQKLLETIRAGQNPLGADTYEKALKRYDEACCRKLTLNIYHANDIVEVSANKPSTKLERINSVVPKTISDFGLKTTTEKLNEKNE